jgi:hypothetical protein
MATDDSTQFPPVGTPDEKLRAIAARAHALLSVAKELEGYETNLATSAVNQLAMDTIDAAEWVETYFHDTSDAEPAERGVETAADAANSQTPASITDDLEAVETFADTLIVTVAPSVEMYDKTHGNIVHRIGMEIRDRVDAIDRKLRSGDAASET